MRFNLNDFRTDPELTKAGVWVDFGGGAEFKLAAFESPAFQEDLRKRTKPYQDLGRDVPEADQEEIMIDLMAKHILLDWKGVYDVVDGEEVELEYSVDNARRLLKEITRVREWVVAQSRKVQNFKNASDKAIEGN